MSSAADLTAASWVAFSRLLDEALERPAGERLMWLEGLGAEHEPLKPALRAVLMRSAGVETAQWLATLPHTDSAAAIAGESDLRPDALVGPYRLLREIGTGGMGAVWLAERADGSLKRQVALKLPRAMWSPGLAQRMARERDILAALEHPNIARLYDAGNDAPGRPFLALEYVEGEPIDAYCRQRSLNLKARLQLLLQVAHAVAFAHSRLVVHRDLKPSNILVTADGQVRLLDFGIAKLM
jgi:serine/threonine-protein kinase